MSIEVLINAPINNLGYGVTGYNIVRELSKKIRVNLFLIGNNIGKELNENDSSIFSKALNNTLSANLNSTSIKIWHQNLLYEHIGKQRYVGFPIFELNEFTRQELSSLNAPDDIIVCSNWAKNVIKTQTDRDSYIVPLGVDTDIFYPVTNNNTGTYNFYSIGKWEYRKGHDILPDLFAKAFSNTDNVRLNMVTHNPFLNQAETKIWVDLYKNSRLGNKINILTWQNKQHDLVDLINTWDCGLFISRAEGWNLPLLEAMACGKPVITTDYSAHTEFCNKDNSYLVDIDSLEIAYDNKWFFGQGEWAQIGYDQEEQIVEHMRYCYKNRPSNKEGIITANKFTWTNSCTQLLKVIDDY